MKAILELDIQETKKKATKLLGPKAKLPDDAAIRQAEAQLEKLHEAFSKISEQLRKLIPPYRAAFNKVSSALESYAQEVDNDKTDFGLGLTDPKVIKLIGAAKTVIIKDLKIAGAECHNTDVILKRMWTHFVLAD